MGCGARPQLFFLFMSPPELLETPPRYVLDCVAVNLDSQKHGVSMSSKREHSYMQDGDHVPDRSPVRTRCSLIRI